MVKIIWTERALNDLEKIGEYISQDSIKYAKITLKRLLLSVKLLEKNPLIVRIVPEIDSNIIRELIEGSYRIVYKYSSSISISALTIHHSSRFLSKSIIDK